MARPRKFAIPEPGVKYGLWTIVGIAQTNPLKMHVKCDCGGVREVLLASLAQGTSTGCGCVRRNPVKEDKPAKKPTPKAQKPIRNSTRPEYAVWASMVQRAKNPKNPMYREGTDIAESWLYFPNFFKDMGERPVGKQLCRRDYEVGFDVNNCYWGEHKDAIENRRKQRPRKGAVKNESN